MKAGALSQCERCPAQLRESQLWKVRVGREIRRFCDACHDAWLLEESKGNLSRPRAPADPSYQNPGAPPSGGLSAEPKREFEWS